MKLRRSLAVISGLVVVTGLAFGVGVALKPKHPTHKVVCSCVCTIQEDGSPIGNVYTFDVPAEGCASLNDTKCESAGEEGKLVSCKKEAVPTGSVVPPALFAASAGVLAALLVSGLGWVWSQSRSPDTVE